LQRKGSKDNLNQSILHSSDDTNFPASDETSYHSSDEPAIYVPSFRGESHALQSSNGSYITKYRGQSHIIHLLNDTRIPTSSEKSCASQSSDDAHVLTSLEESHVSQSSDDAEIIYLKESRVSLQNIDHNQKIFNELELSRPLRKEFKALQTIDPAIDVRLSDTGEVTLTYEHNVTYKLLCSLISKIPKRSESLPIKRQLTKEMLDEFIDEQQSSKSCLIRYHRHIKKEPAYEFCWIHRHLIIMLSRGGEACTSCDSRLEWIKSMDKKETITTTSKIIKMYCTH
jgi:hypothetical protein